VFITVNIVTIITIVHAGYVDTPIGNTTCGLSLPASKSSGRQVQQDMTPLSEQDDLNIDRVRVFT